MCRSVRMCVSVCQKKQEGKVPVVDGDLKH